MLGAGRPSISRSLSSYNTESPFPRLLSGRTAVFHLGMLLHHPFLLLVDLRIGARVNGVVARESL